MHLRTLALAAFVSTAAICAPMRAGHAAMPVTDAGANASLITQISQGVETLANWGKQLKAMTDMLTLQNIAGTVLGEDVGGEFSGIVQSSQDLYNSTNGLYYSLANKYARVQSELWAVTPPPGGYEELTLQQMLSRARAIQQMLSRNTVEATLAQSRAIERQQAYMKEAMTGVGQSDRAVSAVGAVQGLSHIAAAQATIAHDMGQTLGLLALTLEQKIQAEEAGRETAQAQAARNHENMRAELEGGFRDPTVSPSSWH